MGIFSDFFSKKSFPFNLKILKNVSKNHYHPEKYKSKDGIRSTQDADGLRRTNDLIASYIEAIKLGAVGEGLTLQYKSPDEELNNKVESWLRHWSEVGNCELNGLTFRQEEERNMVAEYAIKGGYLVIHHWDKKLPTLYNFEFASCDEIDRTKNDFAKGLYNGVQTDTFGKVIGLYLYNNQERMQSTYRKADKVTFVLNRWLYPNQYTNVTPLAVVFNTLDKMSAYDNAEVESAQERAKKNLIISTPAYDIMLQAQKEYADSIKQNKEKYATAIEQYNEMVSSFVPSGMPNGAYPIMEGSKVWDLKQEGSTVYADITQNSKQIISKGLGLSASTIAGIPESSYNVALKNAQSDERKYAVVAQENIEKAFKEIYRYAIEAGMLKKFYEIKDFYSDRITYNSYLTITRKKIGHIDVLKQSSGDALAVEGRQKSIIDVISDSGKDWQDVIEDEIRFETYRKQRFEESQLTYVQPGQDKIKLEEVKQQLTKEVVDES